MNKLEILVKESGLDEVKSNVLLEKFSDYFKIASEWNEKAKMLVITDVEQVAEMKMAREGRLFLKDRRIMIEKTRKNLKESSLRESQTIDSIAKILTNLIVPIEQDLEQKEKFKEIQDRLKKEQLRQEREEKINQYKEFVPYLVDLSNLSEEDFNKMYNGAKLQYEEKLELDRIKEEQRIKEEKINQVHNDRKKMLLDFWMFIDEEYKNMNFGIMTEKYFDGLYNSLKNRKEQYEKERDIALNEKRELEEKLSQEKKEAERLKAEIQEKERIESERLKAEEKKRQEIIPFIL